MSKLKYNNMPYSIVKITLFTLDSDEISSVMARVNFYNFNCYCYLCNY